MVPHRLENGLLVVRIFIGVVSHDDDGVNLGDDEDVLAEGPVQTVPMA